MTIRFLSLHRIGLLATSVFLTNVCTATTAHELPHKYVDVLSSSMLGPVPAGFLSWRELFVEQAKLNAAADRIESDPAAKAQLAGIIADPTTHHLQVYWKGKISTHTRQLLADIRRTVPVELSSAKYSQTEMLAAGEVMSHQRRVLQVSGKVDGSGLEVVLASEKSLLHGKSSTSLAHKLLAITGLPVEYTYGASARPVSSRDADHAPFRTGARIYVKTKINASWNLGEKCSIGFAIERDSDKTPLWLTAAHCIHDLTTHPEGSPVYVGVGNGDTADTDAGMQIGWIKSGDDNFSNLLDTAIVTPINGSAVGSWVYTGRPSSDMAAIPVAGVGTNQIGNFVFSSGATSGLNGALKITHLHANVDGLDLVRVVHVDIDGNENQLTAVAEGDSGGPVFSFTADGRALAMGLISRTDASVYVNNQGYIFPHLATCPADMQNPYVDNYHTPEGSKCSSVFYFVDIAKIQESFHVTVRKGDWQ